MVERLFLQSIMAVQKKEAVLEFYKPLLSSVS